MLFSGAAVACSSASKEGSAVLAFLTHFWRFAAPRADVLAAVADGAALVPSLPYPSPDTATAAAAAAAATEGGNGEEETVPLPPSVTLSPLSRMQVNTPRALFISLTRRSRTLTTPRTTRAQALLALRRGDVAVPADIAAALQAVGVKAVYTRLLPQVTEPFHSPFPPLPPPSPQDATVGFSPPTA